MYAGSPCTYSLGKSAQTGHINVPEQACDALFLQDVQQSLADSSAPQAASLQQ